MKKKNLIHIEGGEVFANLTDRTITGLLIPFDEVGNTNIGKFTVTASSEIKLPSDPDIIGINTDHERSAGVGRALAAWYETDGIHATFRIANTPEGDAALADAKNKTGKRRALSGEFDAIIKAGHAIAGRLWGAALVERGAFPSAQVLAADTEESSYDSSYSWTDEDGNTIEYTDSSTTTEEIDETEDGRRRVTRTTISISEELVQESDDDDDDEEPVDDETDDDPVDDEEPDEEPTLATHRNKGKTVKTKPVPTSVLAGTNAPKTAGALTAPRLPSKMEVLGALADYQTSKSIESRNVLAALVDIKTSGAASLPDGGTALQPDWVGQIIEGVGFQRQYLPLGRVGTDISIAGKAGFKMKRGTAAAPLDTFDGEWAGNKAAVNSYNGFTQTAGSSRRNFAIANDIAREFYDLPGGAPVIAAFIELIVEDYFVQTDAWALSDWITAAGALVAPATADYTASVPEIVGQITQGILAVKKQKSDGRRDIPSFAIVNEVGFSQLAYAAGGDENLPAFLSLAISDLSKGKVAGNVDVVQGDTGIANSASAIVGADYAIEFDELGAQPIQIDALDIANGGLDRAVHGYLQTFIKRPEAVVHVGVVDV